MIEHGCKHGYAEKDYRAYNRAGRTAEGNYPTFPFQRSGLRAYNSPDGP